MPMTPDSGASSYATIADFAARYDVRALGGLTQDDNTRASAGQVAASDVVQQMLDDASGLVEAACLVGRRYGPDDLAALTGNSRKFLVRIVCDLAYGLLRQRRGAPDPPTPAYAQAVQNLGDLRAGALIFGFVETERAGLAANHQLLLSEIRATFRPSLLLRRCFGSRIQDRYPQ